MSGYPVTLFLLSCLKPFYGAGLYPKSYALLSLKGAGCRSLPNPFCLNWPFCLFSAGFSAGIESPLLSFVRVGLASRLLGRLIPIELTSGSSRVACYLRKTGLGPLGLPVRGLFLPPLCKCFGNISGIASDPGLDAVGLDLLKRFIKPFNGFLSLPT